MPHHFKSVTGYVLAGGASRRMGRPKALLVLEGETMVERQVRLLRAVAHDVYIVGWPAGIPELKLMKALSKRNLLPDDQPGRGPLGGIYTGLKLTRTEYNLFLSCDMPFVRADFLEFLCRRALESRADVTVPKSRDRHLNPVCAIYRRRALPAIRATLNSGTNKITKFFPQVRCEVIPWRDIAHAGFPPTIFENMNTREEYKAAKEMQLAMNQKSGVKNQGLKNHFRTPATLKEDGG